MRLSSKGCYGLRAMIELARQHGGGPVLMASIAERQGISRKYLHTLLTSLRAAGLVRSIRGSSGGYVLARPPAQIRLGEIIGVLEGSLALAGCASNPSCCERAPRCAGVDLWRELSQTMEELLSAISLAEVVARQSRKDASIACFEI